MASIRVDIDLDEFETEEILSELKRRYNRKKGNNDDKELIDEFALDLEIRPNADLPNSTLLDKMKIEFLVQNIEKIRIQDLENLIQ